MLETKPICSGTHKTRLFIGDGNFSYTEAFIQKHDTKAKHNEISSLAHSIISTELVSEIHCSECDLLDLFDDLHVNSPQSESTPEVPKQSSSCSDCSSIIKRIENLKSKGTTVLLAIDATLMSTHEAFKDRKFARIHWNCPHDGRDFKDQSLPNIILKVFEECSKMQGPKSRIHITLAQPMGKKGFYQGYVYDISRAARQTGYTLIKKRKFEGDRYPGYQHTQTNSNSRASVTDEGMREFIFEKVDQETVNQITKAAMDPTGKGISIKKRLEELSKVFEKKCTIKSGLFYKETRFYYECSSDEDSSNCEL